MTISKRLAGVLLAGTAVLVLSAPARAADGATQDRIHDLEMQIQELAQQVQDLKRQSANQYADTQQARAADTRVTIDNARPTIASADGKFSASIRALGQFDAAYYAQESRARNLPAANGPDLSSGSNFRRAQFGVQGKAFGDWSYNFNLEFGGSNGTESAGRIQSLYVQYDGWKPFAVRVGAYPTPQGLDDSTSSSDTLFLERSAVSDVARNLAGGDGRNGVSLIYAGDELFGALSWTGGKVADSAVFDEQNAIVGRAAYLIKPSEDSRIVLSGVVGDVYRIADISAAVSSVRNLSISAAPELTVDSGGIKLLSTGNINTDSVIYWGAEVGANLRNVYVQGGYFSYDVNRRQTALDDFNFTGWYAQASWVITGEAKGYNTQNGAFTPPKPDAPFTSDFAGMGAWELVARYSVLDLNDREGRAGLAMPVNGIRAGEQKIWTAGINWYPNNIIRFALDYSHVDVDRISTSAVVPGLVGPYPELGQSFDTVALRSQLSF